MSTQTQPDRTSTGLGRRAMLERSAVGGAAFAAGFFGFRGISEAAGDSHPEVPKSR